MPPRVRGEAIVIVLDVGKSVSQDICQNGSTFLEMSKSCILRILQRKLFVKSKDEIGLVLLGSKETANSLDYENISQAFSISIPTWEMLHKVENVVQGTLIEADWLDAVVVAMQLLKDQTEGKEFSGKKIVLFTNCSSEVCEDNVDTIVNGIKSLEIDLTVIGPDIASDVKNEFAEEENGYKSEPESGTLPNHLKFSKKLKSEKQETGETLLKRIVDNTGGVLCSFDDAIPQLMFYQRKTVRPTPWNVCLDIGPDIKIPVSGFRKIADVTLPSWKTTSNAEEPTVIEKEQSYFKKDQTTVEKEDRIDGYNFGSTLVPFDDYNKSAMNYQSGDKCLSVLGFTKASNIPRHLLVGVGVYYFVTQKNKQESERALSAVILALEELEMVAIVRRVYNRNTAPYLGMLFPKVRANYQCLVYIELPYAEDIHEYVFPPLVSESNKPTEEQLKAIDSLIDSMDLMDTEQDSDRSEAFHPKWTLIPYHQHFYHTLAYRALHPEKDLPSVSKEIMQLLKSPFESSDLSKQALEAIKTQFELTVVEPKQPRKRAGDISKQDTTGENNIGIINDENTDLPNMNVDALTTPTVVEVGTVRPEQDFQTLLDKGKSFKEVCKQMQTAILSLVMGSFGSDNFPKAQSALKTLRVVCKDKDPCVYNNWLPEFKTSILGRGKDAFWELVSTNKIGLISSEENSNSSISKEAADNFLQIVTENPVEIGDEDMDTEDLLNEM